MAQMGIRKFDDLIGRSDLLDMKHGIAHWKAKGLDFSKVFHQPDDARQRGAPPCRRRRITVWTKALDHQLIAQAKAALETQTAGGDRQRHQQRQPHRRHDAVA